MLAEGNDREAKELVDDRDNIHVDYARLRGQEIVLVNIIDLSVNTVRALVMKPWG